MMVYTGIIVIGLALVTGILRFVIGEEFEGNPGSPRWSVSLISSLNSIDMKISKKSFRIS